MTNSLKDNLNNNNSLLNCPVCKSINIPISVELSEVNLYYCNNCNHRFTDPDSICSKEDYSIDYYKVKHKNWYKYPDLKLFEYLYQQINDFSDKASVLDIGCGNGAFLKYLQKRSSKLNLTGIDLSPNEKMKNITFIQGDIFDIKFNNKFDVIVSSHLIEHIWDVHKFSRKLHELGKKGSIIITLTINDQSLIYKIGRASKKLGVSVVSETLYDKHHVNHFSKNSLCYVFERYQMSTLNHKFYVPKYNTMDIPKSKFLIITLFYKVSVFLLFFLDKFLKQKFYQTLTSKII